MPQSTLDNVAAARRRARRRTARRVLARLRRRPVAWWLATLLLAALTTQVVTSALTRAEAGAARYGSTRVVLVATRDVAAGEVLHADDAEAREVPAGFVPSGAVGADALGSRVAGAIHAGEVVHRRRLAPGGISAMAALLPTGTRGVAIPGCAAGLPLAAGDVVDVLATVAEVGATDELPPTVVVSAAATVLDVGEAAVSIAVPEADAGRVAYAVATGLVTLVLVPG